MAIPIDVFNVTWYVQCTKITSFVLSRLLFIFRRTECSFGLLASLFIPRLPTVDSSLSTFLQQEKTETFTTHKSVSINCLFTPRKLNSFETAQTIGPLQMLAMSVWLFLFSLSLAFGLFGPHGSNGRTYGVMYMSVSLLAWRTPSSQPQGGA